MSVNLTLLIVMGALYACGIYLILERSLTRVLLGLMFLVFGLNGFLNFMPAPNNPPANPTLEPLNNYVGVAEPYNWSYKALANRFDYQHSEKHRFFGRWSWLKYREDRQDWTFETARGLMTNGVNRNNSGLTADWVYTPGNNTVFDVNVAANHFVGYFYKLFFSNRQCGSQFLSESTN